MLKGARGSDSGGKYSHAAVERNLARFRFARYFSIQHSDLSLASMDELSHCNAEG
jgi:hypothetical protein